MPNFVSVEVRVRAEKNRSEFPVRIAPVGGGPSVEVGPGDYIVTHEDGRVEAAQAAKFESGFEGGSDNAERETHSKVQHSVTGGTTVPEGARVPHGSEWPVEGMVDSEEPYVPAADGTENPQQIESAVWQSIPDEVYAGKEGPGTDAAKAKADEKYTAEDRPAGGEAAAQLGHQDREPRDQPNDVEQAQEAHDRLVAVGEAREGATVEHRSDESGEALDTDQGDSVAPDVNDTANDTPEEVEAAAEEAGPANDEPRRPADDLPTS